MKGVLIHAGLLVAALGASLLTWTSTRPTTLIRERVIVWSRDTTEVQGIEFRSESHDIDLGRRAFEAGEYLWGIETRPAADSTLNASILEFPAGAPGMDLIKGYAALGVVRDLGVLPESELPRFGLGEARATLTVLFEDGRRELRIGNETPGDSDRYGFDMTSGRTYVLPGDLVSPLETGEGALRERRIHYFNPADVARVRVEAGGESRVMVRGGEDASGATAWAPADAQDRPDPTFQNFMERLGQLAVEGFRDAATLGPMERRLRVEYFDANGDTLGFVELHRSIGGDLSSSGAIEYFILSERLPVPADAIGSLAERVDGDLAQLF